MAGEGLPPTTVPCSIAKSRGWRAGAGPRADLRPDPWARHDTGGGSPPNVIMRTADAARHKLLHRMGEPLGRNGTEGDRSWREPGFPQTDRDPVVCVNSDDAEAYASWISKETGQHYRLPSESEWEYAARAGTITERLWGNQQDAACLYANVADQSLAGMMDRNANPDWLFFSCSDKFMFTSPVDMFRPNAFGLYDMLGNVRQWTADVYHNDNNGAPPDGSPWLLGSSSGPRVLPGGSWIDDPKFVRSGNRLVLGRTLRYSNAGFRLSRSIPGS
jgi:formylglycine-generating enzyme required for sulfatase activity